MGLPIMQEQKASHQMPATGVPHEQEKKLVAKNLEQVRRRIGVHSGKGGVGKTFVAVNLALLLAGAGKRVGLLDADIDCPNAARLLNLRDVPLEGTADGRIFPLEHEGLKIVSTHFLTDSPAAPMIVRGPIKHKVLAELLSNVEWGELDALIADLPPGTSDVPLSSMLIAGLDGIIVVTTPQKEAIMDARKSALMAKDLDVAVLGIVENMAGEVFGSGSGERLANELGVPFLGSIPLSKHISERNAQGKAALDGPEHAEIAQQLLAAAMGESVGRKRTFWQRLGMEW
jgi:Mrp family chromosome partitioning ATPase